MTAAMPRTTIDASQPKHEEPTGGKEISRMARNKKRRPHGTGCLLKTNTGWAPRWRELEIVADGSTKRVLRYETLGPVSKGEATQTLAARLALAGARPLRSTSLLESLSAQWQV